MILARTSRPDLNGWTAGTMTLQLAENAATAENTTLKAGSYVIAFKPTP